MNYRFTLLLFPLIMLFSCGDDAVTPEVEFDYHNYMPLDTGSHWLYESFGIQNDGNAINNAYGFDSTYAIDSIFFKGRIATLIGNRNIIEGKIGTNEFHYSMDSNQISISNIILQVNDSLKIVKDDWTTIYDLYKGKWFNESISFNDTLIGNSTYNGFIRFDGSNQGDTKIEYLGKKIKAFTTHLVVKYELEQMLDSLVIIDKREEYIYRFAEGIGIIYSKRLEYKDSILVGGYEKVIQDYKIN